MICCSECDTDYSPPDCTDIVQPVDDGRVGNQLKGLVNKKRDAYLESSATAWDQWECSSVSMKRIMYTTWCAEAWAELLAEKKDNLRQVFIDKGFALAADGSEVLLSLYYDN